MESIRSRPGRHRVTRAGGEYHLGSRGVAKRTIADTRREARILLSLFAKASHRGDLRIHAVCVLGNHFHLLAETTTGDLGYTMQCVLAPFARRFNFVRDRHGPLFCGRFWSREVDGVDDFTNVLRYIDRNPVEAGIVDNPVDFPFGSRCRYADARGGPKWLSRERVEHLACRITGDAHFSPETYARAFDQSLDPGNAWIVYRRLEIGASGDSSYDRAKHGGVGSMRDWMVETAELADGPGGLVVVAAPMCIIAGVDLVCDAREKAPDGAGKRVSLRALLRCGLLRRTCGLTIREVAAISGVSRSTVHALVTRHDKLVVSSREYSERAAMVLLAEPELV